MHYVDENLDVNSLLNLQCHLLAFLAIRLERSTWLEEFQQTREEGSVVRRHYLVYFGFFSITVIYSRT